MDACLCPACVPAWGRLPRERWWTCRRLSNVPVPESPVEVSDFYGPALPPVSPTTATPGTEAKILVLAERAEQGRELWHPHDAASPWHSREEALPHSRTWNREPGHEG